MPESKRPLKLFLCHAHADRDPVRGLYTRLTQDGVDAWLDKFRQRTLKRTSGYKRTKSVQLRLSVLKSVESLCHAHADRDPVRGLYARLTQAINGLASGQADNNGQNPFKSVCLFREAVR